MNFSVFQNIENFLEIERKKATNKEFEITRRFFSLLVRSFSEVVIKFAITYNYLTHFEKGYNDPTPTQHMNLPDESLSLRDTKDH